MKIFIVAGMCLLMASICLFGNGPQLIAVPAQKKDSADEVLKKVSSKLHSIKSLKYKYHLELNYASEGFRSEVNADAYLDLKTSGKIPGVSYQFDSTDNLSVYNGSEAFALDKRSKTIKITEKPTGEYFNRITYLYNSPLTLKNVLPEIIKDHSIPRSVTSTTLDGIPLYVIEFILNKKTFGKLGGFDVMGLDRKTIYRLTINQTTYLPVAVLQKNSANEDYTSTTFSKLETNADAPVQLSWYYSSYLNEYKQQNSKASDSRLIAAGRIAPDWTLPVFDKSGSVSLDQFKNKVVLLEFWISQCGFCIAAVPKLNALANLYKGKEFKLLGINAHDPNEIITFFRKNNKPNFEILTSGSEAANAYGVDSFPVIVLIDKTGKVIYSGGLDEIRLKELIDKHID